MTACRSLWLVLVTSALASCRGCSEGRKPEELGALAKTDAAAVTDTIGVERFRARARVPAIAWASVTRGSSSDGAVGLSDVERSEAATATTAFEAASIAKTVIATSVMQLVEENRLALDADVSMYVGFAVHHPRSASTITLRHLLTHTASIVDLEETRASGAVPLGDFLAGYFVDAGSRGVFLDAGPGTRNAYSNVGPSLAALAVERVTGTRFGEVARRRIFEPLRMSATAFGRAATLPPGTRAAAPYSARGPTFVRLEPPSHALYPVVDLFSTARDLARFTRAILRRGELDGARILSPASVDAMLRVQLLDAAPNDALGWQIRTFGGWTVAGHEGEDAGASTGLYVDMESGAGALVLANGDAFQSDDRARSDAVGELIDTLLSEARTSSATESKLRSQDAD